MLAEVPASNSVLNYSDASNYTPKKAVDKLVSSNINFLAIDFDDTLYDSHLLKPTSIEDLCKHIRPIFKELLPLINNANISIAIVTFSTFEDEIISVLHKCFPGFYKKISVKTRKTFTDSRDKFHYMASAACDFNADINKNYTITRATTLLIDDDFLNIKSALENSVRAIQFDKEKPDEIIHTIIDLL